MEQKKLKITKTVIVVLSVLLAVSICALAGTIIYGKLTADTSATVSVPDNIITSEDDKNSDSNTNESAADKSDKTDKTDSTAKNDGSAVSSVKTDAEISLYAKHSQENVPFNFINMLPGDSMQKNFRIKVFYKGGVTVHYKAEFREGDSELLKALNLKIELPNGDGVLYDGHVADMPESVTSKLFSAEKSESELFYNITAYLDTSVGNEYQSKSVIVDFSWWVEETSNLLPSPVTGYKVNLAVFGSVAVISALLILVFVSRRHREDKNA